MLCPYAYLIFTLKVHRTFQWKSGYITQSRDQVGFQTLQTKRVTAFIKHNDFNWRIVAYTALPHRQEPHHKFVPLRRELRMRRNLLDPLLHCSNNVKALTLDIEVKVSYRQISYECIQVDLLLKLYMVSLLL